MNKLSLILIFVLISISADAQFKGLKNLGKRIVQEVIDPGSTIRYENEVKKVSNEGMYGMTKDEEEMLRTTNDAKRETYQILKSQGIVTMASQASVEGMDTIGIYVDSLGVMIPMEPIMRFGSDGRNNVVKGTNLITDLSIRFKGKGAKRHVSGRKGHFRMYFSTKKENLSETYRYFTSEHISIKDMVIMEMKPLKKTREVQIDGNGEAKQSKKITVEIRDVGNGIYDVYVEGEPGEYCVAVKKEETDGPWNRAKKGQGEIEDYVFDFAIDE